MKRYTHFRSKPMSYRNWPIKQCRVVKSALNSNPWKLKESRGRCKNLLFSWYVYAFHDVPASLCIIIITNFFLFTSLLHIFIFVLSKDGEIIIHKVKKDAKCVHFLHRQQLQISAFLLCAAWCVFMACFWMFFMSFLCFLFIQTSFKGVKNGARTKDRRTEFQSQSEIYVFLAFEHFFYHCRRYGTRVCVKAGTPETVTFIFGTESNCISGRRRKWGHESLRNQFISPKKNSDSSNDSCAQNENDINMQERQKKVNVSHAHMGTLTNDVMKINPKSPWTKLRTLKKCMTSFSNNPIRHISFTKTHKFQRKVGNDKILWKVFFISVIIFCPANDITWSKLLVRS